MKVTAGFLGQVLYVNACAMYSSTSMCSLRCSELAADGRWSMMEELAWWPIPAILNMQCRMCQATNTPQSCEFRCAGPPDRPCSSSDTVIVKSDTLGGNLDANMARSRGAMDVILDMRSITESRSSSSHLRMVTKGYVYSWPGTKFESHSSSVFFSISNTTKTQWCSSFR